jgi:type IV pilus assembly protein PilC
MVAGLSSLLEPIIIVFLGTLIGGLVVAMYLPIFKMGQVVG